eukprot:1017156-Prorocentrum_minimum.AAC.1
MVERLDKGLTSAWSPTRAAWSPCGRTLSVNTAARQPSSSAPASSALIRPADAAAPDWPAPAHPPGGGQSSGKGKRHDFDRVSQSVCLSVSQPASRVQMRAAE